MNQSSGCGVVVLGLAIFALAISFGIWRLVERIADCEGLGHGLLYCIVVWGR